MKNFDYEALRALEFEPYFRKNLFARDFYLDLSCYPMCCGCPYFELGCDIVYSCECELLRQVETSINGGY